MRTTPRLRRRRILAAAATAALAPWLASCAAESAGGRSALPTAATAKTVLVFQPWQSAYGFQSLGNAVNELMYNATEPFRAANPSIELRMFGPDINPVAATIAGAGPDVPQLQGGGGGIDGWLTAGLLLDLSPYIQKSNLNMGDFCAGQVETVTTPSGVFGLPNYTGTAAIVVNQSLLDTLGVPYPDPQWDYQTYGNFCAAVSGALPKGQWRYGTTLDFGDNGPDAFYLAGFGGSVVNPGDPATCALSSQESVNAGTFLYDLLWHKTARVGRVDTQLFAQGQEVAPLAWVQQMLQWVTAWRAFKWDFYPMPTWPNGVYSMTNPNYFAINAATKEPSAAWELLQWLCAGPDWQRAMIKVVLLPPGYLPLWPEWVTTVGQVAPPLASKNLAVFADIVQHGHLIQVNGSHFKYADAQAKQLLSSWTNKILAQQLSVQAGFTQAAQQINAFEASAAKEVGNAGASLAGSAKAALANLPAQLQRLPALFPQGGKEA